MRSLVCLLCCISVMMSCNKVKEDKVEANTTLAEEVTVMTNWKGDPLIADLDFVKSIDPSCKIEGSYYESSDEQMEEDNARCVLNKIKYDYYLFQELKARVLVDSLEGGIKLYINTTLPTAKEKQYAEVYHQATLYVEKEGKVVDSMVLYEYVNYMEAMVVSLRYHYLDGNKLYLLDYEDSENGSEVDQWQEYIINNTGTITLVRSEKFNAFIGNEAE